MPPKCSNPEIRAEYDGFSALDQLNDKGNTCPAAAVLYNRIFPYARGHLPMHELIIICQSMTYKRCAKKFVAFFKLLIIK